MGSSLRIRVAKYATRYMMGMCCVWRILTRYIKREKFKCSLDKDGSYKVHYGLRNTGNVSMIVSLKQQI